MKLKKLLKEAINRSALYSIQYYHYDLNTWTVPTRLIPNDMKCLLEGRSIRKVRIEFEL